MIATEMVLTGASMSAYVIIHLLYITFVTVCRMLTKYNYSDSGSYSCNAM